MQVDGNRKQSTVQPNPTLPSQPVPGADHRLRACAPSPKRSTSKQSEKRRAANAAQIQIQSAAVRKAGADAVIQVPRCTSIAEGKRHPLPQGENIAEQRVVHNGSWSQSFRRATARDGACSTCRNARGRHGAVQPGRQPEAKLRRKAYRARTPSQQPGWVAQRQIVLALTQIHLETPGQALTTCPPACLPTGAAEPGRAQATLVAS